jgi:hypothetical protein
VNRSTTQSVFVTSAREMTAAEHGDRADLFVTNVLNGTIAAGGAIVNRGTVVRIRLTLPDAATVPSSRSLSLAVSNRG